MKLIKNEKKYFQQKFSRKILVLQTITDFASRVSKSYVPFARKFPIVLHFVLVLQKCLGSKNNFYVFIYDLTSLKFCERFRLPGSIRWEILKYWLYELCEKES